MTSFLVNDSVCLDAGWVSGALSLREQVKVKDVVISHSHLDHTCSLPFLIDNNFSAPGFTLHIYAIPEVIASMKSHLFNNNTWPDFTCLPNDLTPVLKLVEVPLEEPFRVNGLTFRAVRVSHIVPTTGFIVEDKAGSIAYSSDTAPTDRFWEMVNKARNLKAVITETSFPNELQDLANVSGHLTPQTLDTELRKLKRDVPVYLYGCKPRHLARIRAQVRSLHRRRLGFLTQGKTYRF
jgi:ribonuclease BN (tRNA processing enzyme)